MISATVLAIYFVPLFFVLVRRRFPLKERAELVIEIKKGGFIGRLFIV